MVDALTLYKKITGNRKTNRNLKNDLLLWLENAPNSLLENDLKEVDPSIVVELIGIIHQKDKELVKFAKTDERKHFGIFYTNYNLARFITQQTLSFRRTDPTKNKFLEPCSGTGNFVIAYLDEVLRQKEKKGSTFVQKIVNNIYCADIDDEAIKILKRIIPAYIGKKYGLKIKVSEGNFFTGNILFDIVSGNFIKNDLKGIFKTDNKFDVVITNPPYKLLKENQPRYGNADSKKIIAQIVGQIREQDIYPLNEGTLNYYKLFIEEILTNYTKADSIIGLLVPRTILNDFQSKTLRNHILDNFKTSSIYIIPEKNNFFPDVRQSFCFFSIDKANRGKVISIVDNVIKENDFKRDPVDMDLSTIKKVSSSIIVVPAVGLKILKKIYRNKKLSQFPYLANLRGELDLTLHKKYITKEEAEYSLIKGINIDLFSTRLVKEYVDKSFLEEANGKREFIVKPRIACQQISNIHSIKRIKFAFIEANSVLGNSCNFLSIRPNKTAKEANISLKYLIGILNSYLIDWRFRLSSSNNHVSNYELNELPIAVCKDGLLVNEIETICQKLKNKFSDDLFAKLNILVFKVYNLDRDEALYIASNYKQSGLEKYILNEY